ncbi:MAG TPA: T9SS type A sorting domain-containing protein [Bacteroidia bacterium]
MKTKITMKKLFISAFALYSGFALCNTVTIVNSGSTFSPATVTITVGDTVKFTLTSIHNGLEVSQATWNANGTTALSGGFLTPFGGGFVLPAQLTVGTHYYVCQNHASMGMKGVIIVQSAAGIETVNTQYPALSIYPNPSNGLFNLKISQFDNASIAIYNTIGDCVHRQIATSANCQIDVADLAEGIYTMSIINNEGLVNKRVVIVR